MKAALVLITITMMMLVGCTCNPLAPAKPPAPKQTTPPVVTPPVSNVPYTTQPADTNLPEQSWESLFPLTAAAVSSNNTAPPEETYTNTPWYGGWYYTPYVPPTPPVPPAPKPVIIFWNGTIAVEIQP